jgi:DNA-binding transcriptional LysR family regulator
MAFDGRLVNGIGVLMAVVETGNFNRAAEALGLTQPGVSRAIARLEARVGVRLFDRTTRSVTLTDEGRRFYEQVGPLLNGIEEAATLASGAAARVQGRLRVNVDPFFSRLVLAARLGEFLDLHPDVALDLIAHEHIGDLITDGFDLALRFGEPPSSSLVGRKLSETRILTVAAPAYLKHHGRPKHPADLTGHACIAFRNPVTGQPFEWEFRKGRKVVGVKTAGRLLLNDVNTMLGACVAGAGVAQVMALGVQDLLDQGRLIQLFPDWSDEIFPLYALHPSRHLPAAKVRAFIDFTLQAIG